MCYGRVTWGVTTVTNFDRIFRIQKRAMRIIHKKPFKEHCKPLFATSQILTLPCTYILEICKLFVKNEHKFTNKIENSHNTRRNFIPLPRHRTAKIEHCASYMARKIITKILKINTDIKFNKSFLNKVKNLLKQKAYYELSEFFEDDEFVV